MKRETSARELLRLALGPVLILAVISECSNWLARTGTAAAEPTPQVVHAASTGTASACPTDPVGQIFPSSNPWNTDISALPVLSNSANLVASIGTSASLHPDFGTVYDGAPWGIPFIVADGTQAYLPINFTDYGDQSDPGPYPIRLDAPIEGGAASTGDRHVLVFDTSNHYVYELFYAFPQAAGWDASSGAIFDALTNYQRPAGWTSADAAGLSILAGLARYEEVQCGAINHALRFTAQTTRHAYIYPASHYASSNTDPNVPAMGQRYRLKASINISSFSPQAKIILQALKTYGMIVADNGGNWFVSGAPNPNWNDADIDHLKQIHGSDFEAVDTSSLPPPSDVTNPVGPAGLVLTSAGPSQINLSWPAATDNVGILGYRITASLNANLSNPLAAYSGAWVGNSLAASLTGLAPKTKYYVRVTSYDEAGNASSGIAGNATTGNKRISQLVAD